MRRIKLVVALAAAMVVLMMAAAPAMAKGISIGGGGDLSFHNNGLGFDNLSFDNGAGDLDNNLLFSSSGLTLFSFNNTDGGDIDNGNGFSIA